MASTKIYAPIIDAAMTPIQTGDEIVKIEFALSAFNSSSDFSTVQMTVKKHLNTESVVDSSKSDEKNKIYVSEGGIILNLKASQNKNGIFVIELDRNFLKIEEGHVYDCQIRLVEEGHEYTPGSNYTSYLTNNASFFSEWSTITTLKATGKVDIVYYPEKRKDEKFYDFFTNFQYINRDSSETLLQYSVVINDILQDIVEVSDGSSVIKYIPSIIAEPGKTYKIQIGINTINGVQYQKIFNQKIEETTGDNNLSIVIDSTAEGKENDEGVLKYYFQGTAKPDETYLLRRSKCGVNNWETLKEFEITSNFNLNKIYQDYILESGNYYQYAIQKINSDGSRTSANITDPVIRDFEYSYLIGKFSEIGCRLKIALDTNINSFKINTNDAIIRTIGSCYPFANRSGNNYYKTFSISGIISFNLNDEFCTDMELYGSDFERYKQYEINLDKEPRYNHLHEKKFRDKVYEFLHNGKPKLYKSAQEGNILIALTDISFSPNNNLGRLIYNFSATATEIGECTLDNFYKYGIWNYNGYSIADEYVLYSNEQTLSHEEKIIYDSNNNPIKVMTNINTQHNNSKKGE